MRFNFDLPDANQDKPGRSPSSRTPPTPKDEVEWLPLNVHPVFTSSGAGELSAREKSVRNLMAWDGASRLYLWDSAKQCVHRIAIRLGEPDEHLVIAAFPSKVLRPDVDLKFAVNKISVNKNGSALLLAGSDGLSVMYLSGRTSTRDNSTICRTISVGSELFLGCNGAIRLLQSTWHPYGDTHLGVLSSDSVFRIFDVSSASGKPEQEYYLQPAEPGRVRNAASICPVDFSFGRDHLWDRFSVFILFSDGSVYVICPVAPFGSVYIWDSVMEIYSDAQAFGLKSSNANAVTNSMLAISWLEATFPGLRQEGKQVANSSAVKAHAYALIDASLLLQGPLCKLCHSGEDQVLHAAECEGHAVSFLYNSIGKDSVLVVAWSGGQLQIDALADEIQPLWNTGSSPRLSVDSHDRIIGYAMICEGFSGQLPLITLDKSIDHSDWLGQPPPLLRLAIVDLALPKSGESDSLITLHADPLVPERTYALHDGGVDSVILHFLPFTSQMSGKEENMKAPSVYPVLSTNQGNTGSSSTLCGFVIFSDSFGYSWVAGLTSNLECIVLEMKTWNLLLPVQVEAHEDPLGMEERTEKDMPVFISKELLKGPKAVIIPHGAPEIKANADSVEGRSVLHRYFKLFHENYVEYAHKVYVELKHHGPHTKRIIENLDKRVNEAQKKLTEVEKTQPQLQERIEGAVKRHSSLEGRLQKLRRLPGIHKKPLSKAEREFKAELDTFRDVELDAMQSSIDALNARMRRYAQTSKAHGTGRQRPSEKRIVVPDAQLTQLKAALEKLSLLNSENSKKLKQVETALKNRESEDII
ncbi:hypothetical protein V2J09_003345 [Rumex salicifolius]